MRVLPSLLAAALLSAPLAAQVRMGTSGDGRVLLHNQGAAIHTGVSASLIEPRGDLAEIIERHSSRRGLDPLLVRAVIQVESGYNPRAVSQKGAMGLMQLMPGTAAELRVQDPFDTDANVRGGTDYLRRMLDSFDNKLTLALAGYNAGPEAVRRYGGVPPYQETREYIRRVMRLYRGADFAAFPERLATDGRPTFIVRQDGRLVMTTTPPSRH